MSPSFDDYAARAVTKLSWYTPTRMLLKQCNWLSVRQLAHYHTVLTTHKLVLTETPKYLHEKVCTTNSYNTRTKVKFGDNFTGISAIASHFLTYSQWYLEVGLLMEGLHGLFLFVRFFLYWRAVARIQLHQTAIVQCPGFGILIIIWIWFLNFDRPLIQILVF